MKQLLVALTLTLLVSVTHADTVAVGGAQLSLPDDGWSMKTESGLVLLAPDRGGGIIEVYDFSKVPAADSAALVKLLGGRKETTEAKITTINNHTQNGLSGIAFRGTAKIRNQPIVFSAVALTVGARAVLAISFVKADAAAAFGSEVARILASLRARNP